MIVAINMMKVVELRMVVNNKSCDGDFFYELRRAYFCENFSYGRFNSSIARVYKKHMFCDKFFFGGHNVITSGTMYRCLIASNCSNYFAKFSLLTRANFLLCQLFQ
jgi:hypothetical protein